MGSPVSGDRSAGRLVGNAAVQGMTKEKDPLIVLVV
ncbi:hypothetical protein CCACVL1_19346 [Corchorus capsularis]|uniref:Uncharacterized protein n=1 Tax=Corchorus capsularis TaxID=210143 RepID=A0A1R3HH85_COCAP|nr:hypothetical protein CCACVL1_19346 [Corchorus capsularis]